MIDDILYWVVMGYCLLRIGEMIYMKMEKKDGNE